MILGTRNFTQQDQIIFAELSGDWNPIHTDPVLARRTQIGRQIVHGMNAFLWGIDSVAQAADCDLSVYRAFKVQFRKPIYLDEPIAAIRVEATPSRLRVNLVSDHNILATILLGLSTSQENIESPALVEEAAKRCVSLPRELSTEDMKGRTGCLPIAPLSLNIGGLYRHAAKWLGVGRAAGIVTLSRLVGMECPGMHSLFLDAEFVLAKNAACDSVFYAVHAVDERFQTVRMAVKGAGLSGMVAARVRAEPTRQPTLAKIAAVVIANEFDEQSPLIIGGSRGLGELTAKICAAGGAKPIISYRVGRIEAERVAQEIVESGGQCSTIAYDVRLPAASQLEQLTLAPTQLYYFATSPIARRKRELFERAVLEEFLAFYVTGFYDLCRALHKRATTPFSVFYPSTSYAVQRPRDMTEYVMAKVAGEVLCADLSRYMRGISFISRRLPPLLTDQTASLSSTALCARPMDVLLPIIREMGSIKGSSAKESHFV